MKQREIIFWTTLLVAFVLLVHNGAAPLFIIAYSLIPVLMILFYFKKNLWLLSLFFLFFGILGRYTRFFRQNYASDVLLVTRDFIGFLLAGRSPYRVLVHSQKGLTPFIYLPFELLWYLPAQVFSIDLRFFEMIIASLVPLEVFLYFLFAKKWSGLPLLAVVSLTPFLLDLSADGSNDNSAIFILLFSVLLFLLSKKNKSQNLSYLSAVVLGFSLSFKHYSLFYFLYLAAFLRSKKDFLPLSGKRYLFVALSTAALIILPFFLTSPAGFIKAQFYIENRPGHPLWGWNLWSSLGRFFTLPSPAMKLVRLMLTTISVLVALIFIKIDRFQKVFLGASLSLLVYLIFSPWTTYAYFTFLIPLIALAAINIEK